MLESHYFFPLKLCPSPPDSCLPGAPLPAEVPRRLHPQEGGFSWEPQWQGPGHLVTLPWPSRPEGQPPSLGCTRESVPSQRKPDSTGLRRVSMKGTVLGCLDPTPVQSWNSSLLRVQGWDSSASQEVRGDIIVLPDVRIPEREERRLPRQCNSQKGKFITDSSQGFLPQPTQWCRVRKSLKQRLLPEFIRYA